MNSYPSSPKIENVNTNGLSLKIIITLIWRSFNEENEEIKECAVVPRIGIPYSFPASTFDVASNP